MFLGEHQHSLDAKGRVILPAKYRDQLADGAFVTKGRGKCLCVYPPEEFDEVANRAREASKRGDRELSVARTFFAGAAEVAPDKQGRVAIPQHLRDFAGLERDVIVAGVWSRIEIWDAQRWRARDAEGDETLMASDDLPDFGI